MTVTPTIGKTNKTNKTTRVPRPTSIVIESPELTRNPHSAPTPSKSSSSKKSGGRDESDHAMVQNMGLHLAPGDPCGTRALDWRTGAMGAVERGRKYLLKRQPGSKGFFGCFSGGGRTPDYMVGLISEASQYTQYEDFGLFLRAVNERTPTAELPHVRYTRAMPAEGQPETLYTEASARFARSLASAFHSEKNADGSYRDFTSPDQHAFANVYLFFRVPYTQDREGRGVYISFGRFMCTGFDGTFMSLKPLDTLTPPRPGRRQLLPSPPLAPVGPLAPEHLQDGLDLLASAAESVRR